VDACFSAFDLADPIQYGQFLMAHARAIVGVEQRLSSCQELPRWRARSAQLAADLQALGLSCPPPLAFTMSERNGRSWGALYVLEGSRLGAAVLLRRLAPGLPEAFLSDRHHFGEWNSLLAAIEQAASKCGDTFVESMVFGAQRCFEHYVATARKGFVPCD
jgi:heme oxygenase